MILLTTSDYYPKMGGLATFTANIEQVLKNLHIDFEVFHWKNYQEINQFDQNILKKYTAVINIHSQFSWQRGLNHTKVINFIHGSEVLMTSPNMFKRIYKSFYKNDYYKQLEAAYLNVFISEATLKKTMAQGYEVDYSRDLVLHNCIDTKGAEYTLKNILQDNWVFSCIVRNVPHKNLKGTVEFCELIQKTSSKKIELILPYNVNYSSETIKITNLADESTTVRDEAYKRSHFNVLLSKDHSQLGFYEGFGLTVLEAARFGTPSIVFNSGGLPEAVHHLKTGWVMSALNETDARGLVLQMNKNEYELMSKESFRHTVHSHSLDEYGRLLNSVLKKSEAA